MNDKNIKTKRAQAHTVKFSSMNCYRCFHTANDTSQEEAAEVERAQALQDEKLHLSSDLAAQ